MQEKKIEYYYLFNIIYLNEINIINNPNNINYYLFDLDGVLELGCYMKVFKKNTLKELEEYNSKLQQYFYTLKTLGKQIIIITHNKNPYNILNILNLTKYISCICYSSPYSLSNEKKSNMIRPLLNKYNINKKQCVFFDDSIRNLCDMRNNHGITSIFVDRTIGINFNIF